jgi:N6-adenosine-specific RNA methylase IME4
VAAKKGAAPGTDDAVTGGRKRGGDDPASSLHNQTTQLIRYDAACRALAEAKAVDEVKEVRNEAIAIVAYAKQAKNRDLEANAVAIRMRATRRLGEMIQAQKETVGLNKGAAVPTRVDTKPTLDSQGIDKNLAHEARKLGRMSEEEFEHQVEEARTYVAYGRREILDTAQGFRAEATQQRREKRFERIAAQAEAGPLPQHKFPILYADPPWRYEFSATSTRAIEQNYETMSLEDICALPVVEIACDDAMLFLWVPAPILEQAFQVISAWGFSYRTGAIWDKDQIGAGHYVRQQHEHLLIARRGEFPTPEPARRPSSILRAPRREHSRKPDEAYEIIERMYPELPKIELFARNAREGWAAWGNEAPKAAA